MEDWFDRLVKRLKEQLQARSKDPDAWLGVDPDDHVVEVRGIDRDSGVYRFTLSRDDVEGWNLVDLANELIDRAFEGGGQEEPAP